MSPCILVVEDYPDLRSAIVETLIRRQYECSSAGTAQDAIDKLGRNHYEAILLSPRLPVKDDPVMRFLHETQPEELRKVILMTDPTAEDANDDEDCRVLNKPFNNEELMATLNEK